MADPKKTAPSAKAKKPVSAKKTGVTITQRLDDRIFTFDDHDNGTKGAVVSTKGEWVNMTQAHLVAGMVVADFYMLQSYVSGAVESGKVVDSKLPLVEMYMQPHSKVVMSIETAKILQAQLAKMIKADEEYNRARTK